MLRKLLFAVIGSRLWCSGYSRYDPLTNLLSCLYVLVLLFSWRGRGEGGRRRRRGGERERDLSTKREYMYIFLSYHFLSKIIPLHTLSRSQSHIYIVGSCANLSLQVPHAKEYLPSFLHSIDIGLRFVTSTAAASIDATE